MRTKLAAAMLALAVAMAAPMASITHAQEAVVAAPDKETRYIFPGHIDRVEGDRLVLSVRKEDLFKA